MADGNAQIIDEFRANKGVVGGQFAGAPMILVHHTGARSGTKRINPLVYLEDGDRLIIVASAGGAPQHPDWYHNLKAHPRTTVEVGTETFVVNVTELVGEERDAIWARVLAAQPRVAAYMTTMKTTRTIPVLALTRA